MAHLKYQTLLNYLENRLAAAERANVDAHRAINCVACERRLSLLRAVLAAAADDKTVAPPQSILKRALELHRTRRKARSEPWVRVIAGLRFDSGLQLSATGTRGAARGRQLLFSTEQVDIDLHITPDQGDHNLVGQIISAHPTNDVAPAFVSLQYDTGKLLRGTETDSLGQFAFRQIPPGIYDLVFDLGTEEVAISGLEFRND